MNKNFKRKPGLDPDDLVRTDWMPGDINPTIPGMYAARTGGGHIFPRKWDGVTWRSSIDGSPTTVRMEWRGLEPGTIDLMEYDAATRMIIMSQPTTDDIFARAALSA